MLKLRISSLVLSVVFGCLVTNQSVAAPLVRLKIDSDMSNADLVLLSESGWPLSISMVVEYPEDNIFPSFAVSPNFPDHKHVGILVFDDPDGCLNFPVPGWVASASPECGVPSPLPENWDWDSWVAPQSDETYMEFWPDVDLPGAVDHTGNADRQLNLVDSAGSRGPEFTKWGATGACSPGRNDPDCVRMGPPTGGEIEDGYGFGADDDIPGLVIIAEYGVGRTYREPGFNRGKIVGAVNLAGLVNSVSYNLSDLRKKWQRSTRELSMVEQTRVWAQMNMPSEVVRHIIQYDACTGNVIWYSEEQLYATECDGNNLWRVDGGPTIAPPMKYDRGDTASVELLESTTFTVKAFLVSGHAPDRLFDKDGDGDVDSIDAELAGYVLLSNQDTIQLIQKDREFCWGGGAGVFMGDLDNNGAVDVPIVCPVAPGELARPPR